MRKAIGFALVLILAVATGAAATYWLAPRRAATDVRVTVQSIRKIAQLATVVYHSAALMDREYESRGVFGRTPSSRLLAYYTGAVKGSVDLEKTDISVSAQPDGRSKASIYFQRGSIQLSGVEFAPGDDSMKEVVCWVKKGFNPPSDGQREALRTEALQQIRSVAERQGIVQNTQKNAETILTAFLGGLGLDVEIRFDPEAYDAGAPLAKAR